MRYIDLFSGIGGMRLAADSVFENPSCVLSCEKDKFSRQTYNINFKYSKSQCHVCTKTDIDDLDFDNIVDYDLLLAGFPCKPFSNAGKRLGIKDPVNGNFFFKTFEFIEKTQPKYFLLENVPQFLTMNEGQYYNLLKYKCNELGYNCDVIKICASNFSAQKRQRVFMIGNKASGNPYFVEHNSMGKNEKDGPFIKDILEENVDEKYTISDRKYAGMNNHKKAQILAGRGFSYSIVNHDTPKSKTITARYGNGTCDFVEQDGKNPRKFTPRECARLQSFPDSFIIPVKDSDSYKQFGNSVNVEVMKYVLKRFILDKI